MPVDTDPVDPIGPNDPIDKLTVCQGRSKATKDNGQRDVWCLCNSKGVIATSPNQCNKGRDASTGEPYCLFDNGLCRDPLRLSPILDDVLDVLDVLDVPAAAESIATTTAPLGTA